LWADASEEFAQEMKTSFMTVMARLAQRGIVPCSEIIMDELRMDELGL
jgi:hypothetical protein